MNKISFIGSGNISYHLSKAFAEAGVQIVSISSRNEKTGKELATLLGARFCSIAEIDTRVDLVIIAVADDAISEVVSKIPKEIQSLVHTSGAIGMDVFKDYINQYGVFYPLQSFTKTRSIDLNEVPILIEANSKSFEDQLKVFAKRVSSKVELMNSEERKHLHLAAVIANNFVNYLATEAYQVLEDQGIDGSLIRPLMIETILRLENNPPNEMQTGPAKRMDIEVLKKHEEMLNSNPKLQSLYRQISQLIMQKYNGSEL
jgi:predicted short-subunit dehydrogenase-like oxidoreductase (DUF2520 family)